MQRPYNSSSNNKTSMFQSGQDKKEVFIHSTGPYGRENKAPCNLVTQ